MEIRLHFQGKLYNIQNTMQKVRFTLEEQFFLGGDNVINWKNILLVERLKTDSEGIAFIVHFSDERSATYHQDSAEGEALLNHWEKYAPNWQDGADRIAVG
jgi:hypothetical protein